MFKIFQYSIIIGFLNSYVINFNPDQADTNFTEVQIMGGMGVRGMVSRDCSGGVTSATSVPFQDVGVAVDHYFDSFHAGVKSGLIKSEEKLTVVKSEYYERFDYYKEDNIYYINPNLGLRFKYFGIGIGALMLAGADSSSIFSKIKFLPSASLRVGSLESFYISSSFLNSVPLISGGGFLDLGLGINFGNSMPSLWAGVGIVPSDVFGNFIAKVDIPVSTDMFLNFRGRYGRDRVSDYGLAAGLKIRL
jgi:hypothetical protein